MSSANPPQTRVNKYLQYLSTLSSIFDNCRIALISQGLPTNAKGCLKLSALLNLSKGEDGPYLDLESQFNKSFLL